ncbi:hypothetical protein TNCV_1762491 [Trichonephila clavipes]|nr:hypothetical protein TNCV_1762491 [Trichonephila clavipes]
MDNDAKLTALNVCHWCLYNCPQNLKTPLNRFIKPSRTYLRRFTREVLFGIVLNPTLVSMYLACTEIVSSGIRIGVFADAIVPWSSGTAIPDKT